jgi:hypothetical protein
MKRRYFAQNDVSGDDGHRSKYFVRLEEARAFLAANGGGTIKDAKSPRRYYEEIETVTPPKPDNCRSQA